MKNKTRNIILLISGIFIFCVIGVYAVSQSILSNNQFQIGNVTMTGDGNLTLSNGANSNGVSSGVADIVVCRGTSAWDDYYKSVKWISGCDYSALCKSTDTDCSDEVEQCNGKNCFIRSGVYPVTANIDLTSNTTIIGNGINNTIFIDNGNNNAIFNIDGDSNLEIGKMTLMGNQSVNGGTLLYADPSTINDNIYIHDISFYGKQVGKTMFSPRGSKYTIERIYFYANRFNATDDVDVMSTELVDSNLNDLYFYNCPNSCLTTGEWNNTNVNNLFVDGYSMYGNGAAGFSLECSSAKPCIGAKLTNFEIKNAYTPSRAIYMMQSSRVIMDNINIINVTGNKSINLFGSMDFQSVDGTLNNVNIDSGNAFCLRGKNSNLIITGSTFSNCNQTTQYPAVSLWSSAVLIDCLDKDCFGIVSNNIFNNSYNGILFGYLLGNASYYKVKNNIYMNIGNTTAGEVSQAGVIRSPLNNSIDSAVYGSFSLINPANNYGIFVGETLYNNTNGCRANATGWKCWAMN